MSEINLEQVRKDVDRLKRVVLLGKEDAYFTAWGRTMAWMAEKKIVLLGLELLCVLEGAGLVYVTWQAKQQKSLMVAVDSTSGKAFPVDPEQFFQSGRSEDRSPNEIKGFALEWIREAYEYSFLNTKEKWHRALTFVDKDAQSSAIYALRPKERAENVDRGMDVKIEDGLADARPIEALVEGTNPIRVMVGFRRVALGTSGEPKALPPLNVRLEMRLVPRSPQNPHGLVISEVASAAS